MKSVGVRTALIFVVVPVVLALVLGASLLPLLGAYAVYAFVMLWGARGAGRQPSARKRDFAGIAFMLFLFFGLPTALASIVATTWRTILVAYGIWFGLLGLLVLQGLLSRRTTNGEAVGWPFLMGMFLSMAAVPLITLLLRVTGAA